MIHSKLDHLDAAVARLENDPDRIDIVSRHRGVHMITRQAEGERREVALKVGARQAYRSLTEGADRQLASALKIPAPFYFKLAEEQPALLARTVNTLLGQGEQPQMFRCLDGQVRAVISDRYKRIDHGVVVQIVRRAVDQIGSEAKLVQAGVDDARLWMKFVLPRLEGEVVKGDVVQGGFIITNSETGCGAFDLRDFVYRLVCSNGMIGGMERLGGVRRIHAGPSQIGGEEEERVLGRPDRTLVEDGKFATRLREALDQSLTGDRFAKVLRDMRRAASGVRIDVDRADETIKILGGHFDLLTEERETVREILFADGDFTRWGYLNAVTAAAKRAGGGDRRYEMERIGGKVLATDSEAWARLVARRARRGVAKGVETFREDIAA